MRCQLDVVGLAPSCDFASLADPAGDAQIDARIVDKVLVNELAELPLGRELFTGGEWNTGLLAQVAEGIRTLATDRILDEEWAVLFNLTAELDRICRIQASVDVEADLDLVPKGIPNGLEHPEGTPHGLGGFESSVGIMVGTEPHELPSLFMCRHASFHQFLGGAATKMRVADHFVADPAAEELVDRNAKCLAHDVPQCDVYRRERTARNPVMREEEPTGKPLPVVFDPHRILTNKQWLVVLDHGGDCAGTTCESRLPDTPDTFIRVDDHEDAVASILNGQAFDVGDLHASNPFRWPCRRVGSRRRGEVKGGSLVPVGPWKVDVGTGNIDDQVTGIVIPASERCGAGRGLERLEKRASYLEKRSHVLTEVFGDDGV